jgi:hypothetical protein
MTMASDHSSVEMANDEGADPSKDLQQQNPGETTTADIVEGADKKGTGDDSKSDGENTGS